MRPHLPACQPSACEGHMRFGTAAPCSRTPQRRKHALTVKLSDSRSRDLFQNLEHNRMNRNAVLKTTRSMRSVRYPIVNLKHSESLHHRSSSGRGPECKALRV
ncbi:unnamed protein product [Leuciscus chuanchicus]